MRILTFVLFTLLIGPAVASAAPAEPAPPSSPAKTRVIVLGVDHSAQLVSRAYRPAVLEAFIARAKPDAVCVERDPEDFANNDFYEFTYEVAEIAVPYARRAHIDLCPIDWEPPKADQMLGFGVDLDAPPPVRPAEGFQGFLTFADKAAPARTLFWAEDRSALKDWDAFADQPRDQPGAELSRRMFLYRTMLQAHRIAAAARAHPGKTVLVIVGANHERDIKRVLAVDPRVDLVQAASVGAPTEAEVAAHEAPRFDLAALSFNLLGLQSRTGNVDYRWMRDLLDGLDRAPGGPTPETRLLRARLDRLEGRADARATLQAYQALLAVVAAGDRFTWTGVKDHSRLDSYFDPFGAMTVRERLQVEIARELYALGQTKQAEAIRADLTHGLGGAKAAEFAAYWPAMVQSPATQAP